MTVVETQPHARDNHRPDDSGGSPFWWIALVVTVVAMLVGAAVFVDSIINEPTRFTEATVPLTVADFRVSGPSLQFSPGAKTLQITNKGATQHELLVFHPDATIDPHHLPLGDDGNIVEDAPGVNLISDGDNIDPGQSQTRDLDLSQPGTYVFLCNLPEHYKQGMAVVVTVG